QGKQGREEPAHGAPLPGGIGKVEGAPSSYAPAAALSKGGRAEDGSAPPALPAPLRRPIFSGMLRRPPGAAAPTARPAAPPQPAAARPERRRRAACGSPPGGSF